MFCILSQGENEEKSTMTHKKSQRE